MGGKGCGGGGAWEARECGTCVRKNMFRGGKRGVRGLRSVYIMETGCMCVCVCVWGGGGGGWSIRCFIMHMSAF